jgi:triacylglycerol lipase
MPSTTRGSPCRGSNFSGFRSARVKRTLVSSTAQVFLVPGFFGFQTIAGLPYFTGVQQLLSDRLAELGVSAQVHALDTLPTASIENRARYLGNRIAEIVPDDGSDIHLVGHSSGGLDARVLLSPSTLPDLAPLRARVRSMISLATPHCGTPLADYFARVEGQKLLRLFGLLSVHSLRLAGRPLATTLSLGRLVARIDELITLRESAIDRVYALLADPLSTERLRPLEEFGEAILADQSLIRQLSPNAMAGFDARIRGNPSVRYASVLTRARPPRLRGTVELGFNPIAQVSHALYQGLYRLSATQDPKTFAPLRDDQQRALIESYGKVPDVQANDGFVPTRSQIHASVIHVARADHHDVIGYFGDRHHEPPHIDWVATGCGFRWPDFDRLWTDVARFMAR